MLLLRLCCSLSCFVSFLRYAAIVIYLMFWALALFCRNNHVRYSMPEIFYDELQRPALGLDTDSFQKMHKDFCRLRLGSMELFDDLILDPALLSMKLIQQRNPNILPGGHWSPQNDCVPFQKVAIILPYRDRLPHLLVVLNRLHTLLQKQRIDYRIIVVEQTMGSPFNRGLLLNIGALEAIRLNDQVDCFIFHDVDMIPEHDRNIYLCDHQLRHLSSAIDEMRYHVMYDDYVGGVLAVARDNFFKLNGFANIYWGWGNEDDDFSARSLVSGYFISRPPEHIGRYKMIKHLKSERNDAGYSLFAGFRGRQWLDGLNSLHRLSMAVNDSADSGVAGSEWGVRREEAAPPPAPAASSQEWLLPRQAGVAGAATGPNARRLEMNYEVLYIQEEPLYTNVTVRARKPDAATLRQVKHSSTRETLFWILRFYGWLNFGGNLT